MFFKTIKNVFYIWKTYHKQGSKSDFKLLRFGRLRLVTISSVKATWFEYDQRRFEAPQSGGGGE
jgi:hypothetical protein